MALAVAAERKQAVAHDRASQLPVRIPPREDLFGRDRLVLRAGIAGEVVTGPARTDREDLTHACQSVAARSQDTVDGGTGASAVLCRRTEPGDLGLFEPVVVHLGLLVAQRRFGEVHAVHGEAVAALRATERDLAHGRGGRHAWRETQHRTQRAVGWAGRAASARPRWWGSPTSARR